MVSRGTQEEPTSLLCQEGNSEVIRIFWSSGSVNIGVCPFTYNLTIMPCTRASFPQLTSTSKTPRSESKSPPFLGNYHCTYDSVFQPSLSPSALYSTSSFEKLLFQFCDDGSGPGPRPSTKSYSVLVLISFVFKIILYSLVSENTLEDK